MHSGQEVRRTTTVDRKRHAIVILVFAASFLLWWFTLPVLQSLVLPNSSESTIVVRPVTALRFCATAILWCATVLAVLPRLHAIWRAEDVARGTRLEPKTRRFKKIRLLVVGIVSTIVYGIAAPFYVLSWTEFRPDVVLVRQPWAAKSYGYDEVATLTFVPIGFRSDRLKQNGPWYAIGFSDGTSVTLSLDNERISIETLHEVENHVADESRIKWSQLEDITPR